MRHPAPGGADRELGGGPGGPLSGGHCPYPGLAAPAGAGLRRQAAAVGEAGVLDCRLQRFADRQTTSGGLLIVTQ